MRKEERAPYDIACGKRLRWARTAKGFSRAGLAKYLFDLKTKKDRDDAIGRIKSWELGKAQMPARYADRLEEVIGIGPAWFYSGKTLGIDPEIVARMINLQEADAAGEPVDELAEEEVS